ncbi:MAG: tetratricopeptide repeat protein, partial [Promethearchaeia archaeon]
ATENPAISRRQASVTKVKDQEMLAFACRRANKTRSEALAYYNMGVLHDNDQEFDKANSCYDQYLKAARAAGDAKGEQLALNSMGINHLKLDDHAAAIEAHNQHLQVCKHPLTQTPWTCMFQCSNQQWIDAMCLDRRRRGQVCGAHQPGPGVLCDRRA